MVPDGYDALVYNIGQNDGSTYAYQYVLQSSSQILPEAFLQFVLDESMVNISQRNCQECESQVAKYFCTRTEHYMCLSCAEPMLRMKTMKKTLIPVEEVMEHPLILGNC